MNILRVSKPKWTKFESIGIKIEYFESVGAKINKNKKYKDHYSI